MTMRGDGALRSNLIDLLATDADIQHCLDRTLHADSAAQATVYDQVSGQVDENAEQALDDDIDLPELCPFFLCRSNTLYQAVTVLTKNFWNLVKTHQLTAADLLMFSVAGNENQQIVYFLGTMLKRPLQQMLVEAVLEDQEVQFKLTEGRPHILSSHELFLGFLEESKDLSQFQLYVEAWKCQAFLGDFGALATNATRPFAKFSLTTTRLPQGQSRSHRKLPFGLKLPSKPRKQVTKKSRSGGAMAPKKILSEMDMEVIDLDSSETGDGNGHSDGNLSEDDDDSEPDVFQADAERESETVVPPSKTIASEQRAMEEVAKEIESSVQLRDETAEAIRENKQSSASSFFSKDLGFSDIGVAASGRSICLSCKKFIPKGSIRYSWFHSRVRPHGWVHAHCILQQIMGSEPIVKDVSVRKLDSLVARLRATGSASSSSTLRSQPLDAEMLSSACAVQKALREKSSN